MSAETFGYLRELLSEAVTIERVDDGSVEGVFILCARCNGQIGGEGRIVLTPLVRALCPRCFSVERPDPTMTSHEFLALLLNRAGHMVHVTQIGDSTNFVWSPRITTSRS